MKLLFLDLESTGLNTKEDRITEICACLWESKSKEILRFYNSFVKSPDLPKGYIKDETIELNGITNDMIENYGLFTQFMFWDIAHLFKEADYVCAHNGNMFDKPLFLNELNRYIEYIDADDFLNFKKHWIDSSIDIPYPDDIKTRKLVHLAAEHGFINPFPHRAFADVLTMIKIIENYNIEEIIERSKIPNIKVTALVTFHNKELAKNAGFRWDNLNKLWTRTYKLDELEKIRNTFLFDTKEEIDTGLTTG